MLTDQVSWGWIFFINVPLGLVTAGLAIWAIDESRDPVRRRLDPSGLVASTLALSVLTFVAIEAGATDPMVDVALFRDPVFGCHRVADGVGVRSHRPRRSSASILTNRQDSLLEGGSAPMGASLGGYRVGLVVAGV